LSTLTMDLFRANYARLGALTNRRSNDSVARFLREALRTGKHWEVRDEPTH
jgi:hypothetical protein